jgi:hypothetical protein
VDFGDVALCKSITACCFFFNAGCFFQQLETVFYLFRYMGSGVFRKLRGKRQKRATAFQSVALSEQMARERGIQ